MSYAEDLLKLRKRVLDAVKSGLIDDKQKDFYEATLIQIMNEAERQRQHCTQQAENLRKQASVLDGQASGYSSQSSIVYNVLNSYILAAERAAQEEKIHKEELLERKASLTENEKKNLANIEEKQNVAQSASQQSSKIKKRR